MIKRSIEIKKNSEGTFVTFTYYSDTYSISRTYRATPSSLRALRKILNENPVYAGFDDEAITLFYIVD